MKMKCINPLTLCMTIIFNLINIIFHGRGIILTQHISKRLIRLNRCSVDLRFLVAEQLYTHFCVFVCLFVLRF